MNPTTLEVLGIIVGCLVAIVVAFAYLTSRYRKAVDVEREKYIDALEERNSQLEEEARRHEIEIDTLRNRLDDVERKLGILQDLVLRQCRFADIDPGTGACRYCTRGLLYGGKPKGVTD